MKKKVGTINLAPTPTAYALCLITIVRDGDAKGKEWAQHEIVRLAKAAATLNPEAWGKENE